MSDVTWIITYSVFFLLSLCWDRGCMIGCSSVLDTQSSDGCFRGQQYFYGKLFCFYYDSQTTLQHFSTRVNLLIPNLESVKFHWSVAHSFRFGRHSSIAKRRQRLFFLITSGKKNNNYFLSGKMPLFLGQSCFLFICTKVYFINFLIWCFIPARISHCLELLQQPVWVWGVFKAFKLKKKVHVCFQLWHSLR